jgi:hypothetical protein
MIGAFLYLTWTSIANRVRVRVRRLREPRYAIGLAAGILYFYAVIFRPSATPKGRTAFVGLSTLATIAGPLLAAASVLLFVIVALAWILPSNTKSIAFSKAEVQMLFPAPLTRRQLLHYKLIRSQVGSLFGSAILAVFLRPQSVAHAWMFLTGVWLAFGIINLHFTGVALTRQSLSEHGTSGWRRQWLPVALIFAAGAAIVVAVVRDWSILAAMQHPKEVVLELTRVLTTGPAGWALWPTRALIRVPLSSTILEYGRALPAVLAIFALNYVWVMRTDASFEEAAAERSERVVRGRVTAPKVRVGAVSTPFKLAPQGRIETAILWKNLILVGRYASLRMLWRVLPAAIALAAAASGSKSAGLITVLAIFALILVMMTVLAGPQMARNDLRQDLGHLATLKTWPVSSAALVRGELLAPAALLTAFAWTFIVGALFLVPNVPNTSAKIAALVVNRVSYGLGALLIAPAIILVQLIVHNGMAILFPAWVAIGATRSRGVDVLGQRLVMQLGIWIALLLAILPAALVAGAVGLGIYWATGALPIVVPAAIGSAVILAECLLATELLGKALDRADVGSLEPTD